MNISKKYENYIYLTICEASLDKFNKSNFSTYLNYINNLSLSFESNTLSYSQCCDVMGVVETISTIYSLSVDDSLFYIKQYLKSDRILQFEKSVRLVRMNFPFTGISK